MRLQKPVMTVNARAVDDNVVSLIAEYIGSFQHPPTMSTYRRLCKAAAEAGEPHHYSDIAFCQPHCNISPLGRIKAFLQICQQKVSLATHPRRLHLSVDGERCDQSWMCSEEMEDVIALLASMADFQYLNLSGGDTNYPLEGLHAAYTLQPLAHQVQHLVLDNVVGVPYFFLSLFTRLQHLVLRGAKGEGPIIPPPSTPPVALLQCYSEATVGSKAFFAEHSLLSYIGFNHLVSFSCDVVQYREAVGFLGPMPASCLAELRIDVSMLCGKPSIAIIW
jgi:hypothetical protein